MPKIKKINRIIAGAEQYLLMMFIGLGVCVLFLFIVVGIDLIIGHFND